MLEKTRMRPDAEQFIVKHEASSLSLPHGCARQPGGQQATALLGLNLDGQWIPTQTEAELLTSSVPFLDLGQLWEAFA